MEITDLQIHNLRDDAEDILSILNSLVPVVIPPVDPTPPIIPSIPLLTVDHIIPNDGSVKIYITPVEGAVDYRVYDPSNLHFVKYAGGSKGSASRGYHIPQWGNWNPTKELPCIEFNGIQRSGCSLIVEAVDRLGPYMDHMVQGLPMPVCTTVNCSGVLDPLCDDTIHKNGHGNVRSDVLPDDSTFPVVLARSEVFVVTPVPIVLSGEQQFIDRFDTDNPFVQVPLDPRINANGGDCDLRLENSNWVVEAYHCIDRVDELKCFIDHDHLMTVIADGGRTWDNSTTPPTFIGGQGYATMSLRPKHSVDISNGKIAHFFGEWDSHVGGRRWQDIFIGKKGDFILNNNWRDLVLNPLGSKNGIITTIGMSAVQIFQFDERSTEIGTPQNGTSNVGEKLVGDTFTFGTSEHAVTDWNCFRATPWAMGTGDNGHESWSNGLDNDIDNRHRWDVYLSSTRVVVMEEGVVRVDWTLPMELDYTELDVWFCTHLYHSQLEHNEEVTNYKETETLWINHTPFIDQRHYDNLGMEVLSSFPGV